MKQVLLFSAVLFFGLCCTCDLCAQNCQPNPACKAICSASKAGVQSDAANMNAVAGLVPTVAVSQQATVAGSSVKKAACDPTKCDLTKCDPSQCDPTKCDPKKCDPADCDPSKCIPGSGAGGAKAQRMRI